ncbi:hypothetical protein JCM33374_g5352 [Metschnikowia sp. JCM 33374]|nr:hypothetical protein JCM33374_g5352 [Metschnikowia sp. JCM 33374]
MQTNFEDDREKSSENSSEIIREIEPTKANTKEVQQEDEIIYYVSDEEESSDSDPSPVSSPELKPDGVYVRMERCYKRSEIATESVTANTEKDCQDGKSRDYDSEEDESSYSHLSPVPYTGSTENVLLVRPGTFYKRSEIEKKRPKIITKQVDQEGELTGYYSDEDGSSNSEGDEYSYSDLSPVSSAEPNEEKVHIKSGKGLEKWGNDTEKVNATSAAESTRVTSGKRHTTPLDISDDEIIELTTEILFQVEDSKSSSPHEGSDNGNTNLEEDDINITAEMEVSDSEESLYSEYSDTESFEENGHSSPQEFHVSYNVPREIEAVSTVRFSPNISQETQQETGIDGGARVKRKGVSSPSSQKRHKVCASSTHDPEKFNYRRVLSGTTQIWIQNDVSAEFHYHHHAEEDTNAETPRSAMRETQVFNLYQDIIKNTTADSFSPLEEGTPGGMRETDNSSTFKASTGSVTYYQSDEEITSENGDDEMSDDEESGDEDGTSNNKVLKNTLTDQPRNFTTEKPTGIVNAQESDFEAQHNLVHDNWCFGDDKSFDERFRQYSAFLRPVLIVDSREKETYVSDWVEDYEAILRLRLAEENPQTPSHDIGSKCPGLFSYLAPSNEEKRSIPSDYCQEVLTSSNGEESWFDRPEDTYRSIGPTSHDVVERVPYSPVPSLPKKQFSEYQTDLSSSKLQKESKIMRFWTGSRNGENISNITIWHALSLDNIAQFELMKSEFLEEDHFYLFKEARRSLKSKFLRKFTLELANNMDLQCDLVCKNTTKVAFDDEELIFDENKLSDSFLDHGREKNRLKIPKSILKKAKPEHCPSDLPQRAPKSNPPENTSISMDRYMQQIIFSCQLKTIEFEWNPESATPQEILDLYEECLEFCCDTYSCIAKKQLLDYTHKMAEINKQIWSILENLIGISYEYGFLLDFIDSEFATDESLFEVNSKVTLLERKIDNLVLILAEAQKEILQKRQVVSGEMLPIIDFVHKAVGSKKIISKNYEEFRKICERNSEVVLTDLKNWNSVEEYIAKPDFLAERLKSLEIHFFEDALDYLKVFHDIVSEGMEELQNGVKRISKRLLEIQNGSSDSIMRHATNNPDIQQQEDFLFYELFQGYESDY